MSSRARRFDRRSLWLTSLAHSLSLGGVHGRFTRCLWVTSGLIGLVGGLAADDVRSQLTPAGEGLVVLSVSPSGASSFRAGLWTSRLDGSEQRVLTPVPTRGDRHDYEVAVSPDGSEVAFVREGRSGEALFVVSVHGGAVHRLVGAAEVGRGISGPTWSPDGTTIAFAGGACTRSRAMLYTIGADGTSLTAIAPSPADTRGFASDRWTITPWGWSRDGAHVLYELDHWAPGDCALDANFEGGSLSAVGATGGGSVRLLADTALSIGQAMWSPDGTTIAYSLTNLDASSLLPRCGYYLMGSGGGSKRLLTSFGDLCRKGLQLPPDFGWDPSGNALIFGTRTGLKRVPIATGQQAIIVRAVVDTCCWVSSDAQIIAFTVGAELRAVSATGQPIATTAIPKGLAIFSLGRRYIDVHLP